MSEFIKSQIPERCHTCPAYIINAEEIAEINAKVDELTSIALGDDLDKATKQAHELLVDLDATTAEAIPAEKMAHAARKNMGGLVEALNDKVTSLEADMAKLALNCFGPAVITGEANRRSYEVTVCASGSNPGEEIQPAVIKSQRI